MGAWSPWQLWKDRQDTVGDHWGKVVPLADPALRSSSLLEEKQSQERTLKYTDAISPEAASGQER